MPALLPPTPVNPTGQLAQQMPGYDPAPVLAAQEQNLQDFLNLPVKEILARLGLPSAENAAGQNGAPPPEPQPDPTQPPANAIDPMALISPVTDALSTLGTGLFQGADPTAMFQGISQAFQSTGGSLQQSLGSVDNAWQGASGTAATAKTATAMANGTELGTQSDSLRTSLATAATNVAQARVRLIEIVTEFQTTLAAIGPNIIFPWGWAAAIAAANKAIATTAEVMTELQTSLGAQAAEVTAAGTPVDVTAAPTAGASPLSSLASPLMSMATKGAQAGIQAGTGAASAASQAAQQTSTDAAAPAAGGVAPLASPGAGGAGGGAGGGGVGGSGAAPLRSISSSAMMQPETASTTAQSAVRPAAVGTAGSAGSGMMGGGAPYAPMAGQGANNASNSHSAASFLHTTDQGGEIVGDLGNAAPPVLGEADPNEPPDVELRI
jgi:uncharacterized protein YukE